MGCAIQEHPSGEWMDALDVLTYLESLNAELAQAKSDRKKLAHDIADLLQQLVTMEGKCTGLNSDLESRRTGEEARLREAFGAGIDEGVNAQNGASQFHSKEESFAEFLKSHSLD
jgi:predicted  nucleic acid-binding Zn-ribbon protein